MLLPKINEYKKYIQRQIETHAIGNIKLKMRTEKN